jgi:hypothetical protein
VITIKVTSNSSLSQVESYLPSNYEVAEITDDYVIVKGEDFLGWTAEDYVIPRLFSGLYRAEIIEDDND